MDIRFYYDAQYQTSQHPQNADDLFSTREEAERACKTFCGSEYDPDMVYEIEVVEDAEDADGTRPFVVET